MAEANEAEPAEPKKRRRGTVYTFYSYKGGVGRSMALANVGASMALSGFEEKSRPKVLLVDWDLEAPGLETFFQRSKRAILHGDPQIVPGVLDLLEARAEERNLSWRSCLLHAEFAGASLDIITSGSKPADDAPSEGSAASGVKKKTARRKPVDVKQSTNYRQRVQKLDWPTLFDEHDIGNYIWDLRNEWRDEYDFILIDSRTGITDIGDICTVLLPDALILLFVSNYQNVEGVRDIVDRARAARARLPLDRQLLMAVPVPSRDESRVEYHKTLEWRRIYSEKLGHLFDDWLHKDFRPADVLNSLYIPYMPIWSFGESLPVLEGPQELRDPASLGYAYNRLALLLKNRLDWQSVVSAAGQADLIASTQAELAIERSTRESIQFSITRWSRWGATLSILTALATGGLGIVLGTRYVGDSLGELHVMRPTVHVDPISFDGWCPVTINAVGRISIQGRIGTVAYRWLRSDGGDSPVKLIDIGKTGTQEVSETWTVGGPGIHFSGWLALKTESPQETESDHIPFSISCNAPLPGSAAVTITNTGCSAAGVSGFGSYKVTASGSATAPPNGWVNVAALPNSFDPSNQWTLTCTAWSFDASLRLCARGVGQPPQTDWSLTNTLAYQKTRPFQVLATIKDSDGHLIATTSKDLECP